MSSVTSPQGTPVADKPDTSLNFGSRGWIIITISGLLIWLAAGIQVHGLNIMTPALSGEYGIPTETLLYLATPATWGSVLSSFIVAKLCEKFGSRINVLISLAVGGVAFGLLGTFGGTVAGFFCLFFLVNFFGTGFGYVGGLNLIANWFPRKKTLALGFVTMGQTISSALFVPLLAFFIAQFGVKGGFWAMGVLVLCMIPIVLILVRNYPEELGKTPDNIPMTPEEIEESRKAQVEYRSPLSVGQLLKMKDVWLLALASGGIYVMLVGVQSQLVPRQMDLGLSQEQAIMNLSIAAFIGLPGAFVWGWLGQRFSARIMVMVYTCWWLIAIAINAYLPFNTLTLWIALVMIGFSFGGATGLTTAFVADKFRRGAFIGAFAIIQPIQGIIRSFSYSIIAFGTSTLGGFTGAYTILIIVGIAVFIMFMLIDPNPLEDSDIAVVSKTADEVAGDPSAN